MAEMNPVTASLGLILGILFSGFLFFVVLPRLDHIVKREYGIFEAMILTRFCAICVALPFYTFTVWMTIVIIADGQKGISIIEELCPNNYDCSNTYALGRAQFEKGACTDATCSDDELHARSGSQPSRLHNLGLGQNLSPVQKTFIFDCTLVEDGVCLTASVNEETFDCAGTVEMGAGEICEGFQGFNDDLADAIFNTVCTEISDDECLSWQTDTDSKKQFSFQTCACVNDDCTEFSCDVFTMKYFYPNVFYAGAATILFVFPALFVTYTLIKAQVAKVIKCGPLQLLVFSQDAGVQDETTPENLATGGFNVEQTEKVKANTLNAQFFGFITLGMIVLVFFSWLIVQVSGRVGLSFICLSASLLILFELYSLRKHCVQQSAETEERKQQNTVGEGHYQQPTV